VERLPIEWTADRLRGRHPLEAILFPASPKAMTSSAGSPSGMLASIMPITKATARGGDSSRRMNSVDELMIYSQILFLFWRMAKLAIPYSQQAGWGVPACRAYTLNSR
jgi:hypothetical protein